MAQLSFVTTCMARLTHLKLTIGRVVAQPDSACVVVDYSCPQHCGDWISENHREVRVVRVSGKTTFNRSPAANAGARVVTTPWICFFDCDILFESAFAETILSTLEPGYYYCPDPIRDSAVCGTFICSREDFERIGGYDEVYQGWGERDLDVYSALEFIGVKRKSFPSSLLRHLPHSEQLRVQFHNVKTRHVSQTINRIYRFVKFDVMHATGDFLSSNLRAELYEKAAERTRSTIRDGKPLDLAIEIPAMNFILTYKVHGITTRPIMCFIGMIYSSNPINRLHRFVNTVLLRKSLDLTEWIYGRHLPFGLRLEVTLSSTGNGVRSRNPPSSFHNPAESTAQRDRLLQDAARRQS